MHKTSRLAALAIVILNACGDGSEPWPEQARDTELAPEIGLQSSAIVNGAEMTQAGVEEMGMIAVYHWSVPHNTWFSRPCSGTVVRSSGGVSKILTARHCVTEDAEVDGPLLTPSKVRVIQTAKPGPAVPTLPPNTIAAATIEGMPVTAEFSAARDLAVVTVNATLQTGRYGFYLGDPSGLAGKTMMAYGYGINTNSGNCYGNAAVFNGAGVARRAQEKLQVFGGTRTASTSLIRYNNIGTGSVLVVICGDSGGADFIGLGPLNMPHLMGVHSIGGAQGGDAAPNTWLQIALGGIFLSPEINHMLNLGLNGNVVTPFPISDARSQKFVFNHSTGALSAFPVCMRVGARSTDGQNGVIMGACDSAARWTMSNDRQLMFQGDAGKCLTLLGGEMVLAPCTSEGALGFAQRWLFHPQQ